MGTVLPQLILSGLLFGGIYVLVAVGATLVFGVLDVVNFAHGEYLMLAMYLTFWLFNSAGLDPYLALPIVGVLMFLIGMVSERFLIRPTIGRGAEVQIFVTLGLSVVMENLALMTWGANFRSIRVPYATATLHVGELVINVPRLVIFLVTMAIAIGLHFFLQRTWMGKAIRATAADRNTARLMGIDIRRVYNITFAIGSALVGIAGALLMPLYSVYPQVGFSFVIVAFISVVMGGLGSVTGAVISGLFIGLVEVLSSYWLGPEMKQIVYFTLFILVLIFRPNGLFGKSIKVA